MADTLKEIFNGNLTIANLAATGSYTFLTTDANTQYVIKDVQTNGKNFGTSPVPYLMVNGFAVANLLTNAGGSEIVDTNSSVSAKVFDGTLTVETHNLKYVSDSKLYTRTYSTVNGATVANSSDTYTDLGSFPNLSTQNANLSISSSGAVFYTYMDGNSSCQLIRRVSGTNTTITNPSYGWCVFDGGSNYYYTTGDGSSTLVKYNIETQTSTSLNTTTLSTNSYPNAYYMNNGMILFNYSANNQANALGILNPATGAFAIVTGLTGVNQNGTTYRNSGYYNSTTGLYTLYRRAAGTLYKCQLDAAITLNNGTYNSAKTETVYTIPTLSNAFNDYVTQDNINYSWGVHGASLSKTQLSTYNTATGVTTLSDWVPVSTTTNQIFYSKSTPTVASFTGTLGLRITGVKSTI
jgi:hypothetical protein